MQAPTFQAFQASDSVRFVARKEARVLAAAARVLVLALNVQGPAGLKDEWRLNVGGRVGVNGLSNASVVRCGAPALCAFDASAPCATIWLQPVDMPCIDMSTVVVTVSSSESDFTDETSALIVLDLRAQRIPEGLYSFTLHLPVANSTAWQHQSIAGALEVVGIADAAQSEASVCQGAVCASASGARFNSTNGGGLP